MATLGLEVPGLWVNVDRVDYVPAAFSATRHPHQFVYYITIHNDSLDVVHITGRRWIVTDVRGHKRIIEGDGVVGQTPRLVPGDTFHYHSYHLIESESSAEGVYLGRDEQDQPVIARIPRFQMTPPPPKDDGA